MFRTFGGSDHQSDSARKGGKSESKINIGRQNIEYGTKESEIDTGRNSLEYDTKEIDPLKDKEEEENPEDDPDVQDIRWF